MNQFTELLQLVKTMRGYQKAYFKTRHPKYLEASKSYEKKVDAFISEHAEPKLDL